mmetsp:Transcript_117575/g.379472  ORF Transcript_117575/g.379472 Transcript_117575/m.379472 type:complete len:90 (+) Transcript_117575:106-375(+)
MAHHMHSISSRRHSAQVQHVSEIIAMVVVLLLPAPPVRSARKPPPHPVGTSEYLMTSLCKGSVGWLCQGLSIRADGPLSSCVRAGATFF